ncbi:sigma-70 family RNA polymerase sigma factor [Streptosporangium sp. NPDC048865]|uniref:RNA polymerase sigma factor n=1 Tax=Streptosporangium sp. NPDC048865 TaxID=3155766 RepID=UPI0034492B45
MRSFADGRLPSDDVVVAALRAGDEAMFTALLDTWSRGMLWLARAHVSTNDSAEEVVQDTWLAVIRGIEGFKGRSSVKTWVYRILVNTARRRGVRENRTVPWSSAFGQEKQAVDHSCFQGAGDPSPGHWKDCPTAWPTPESEVLAAEVRGRIAAALAELPIRQRTVITLRDVEGCTSQEVCEILEISAANQRVLLHRARATVRERLEDYFGAARRPA